MAYTYLSCKFNKELEKPWDCKLDELNYITREILSQYPEGLAIGHGFVGLTVSATCHFNEKDSIIRCGDDHTLRVSDKGELIVIKKHAEIDTFVGPHGVTDDVKLTNLNPLLWARNIEASSTDSNLHPFSLKIASNVLTKSEKQRMSEDLRTAREVGPDIKYDVDLYYVFEKAKKDFSSEYKTKDGKPLHGVKLKESGVDKSYQSKWTIFEALREWIANAHDVTSMTGDTRFYEDEDGNMVIEYDTDRVLMLKHLLILGTHEVQKGKKTIGVFGEGITLGSLVFARMGIPVRIEAIGKTYYPELKYDNDFETETLHAYFKENDRTYGTKLTFIGVPPEVMEKAKRLFLFNREGEYEVIHTKEDIGSILEFNDDKKRIVVRDLIITGREAKSMQHFFSYNFVDKNEELLNRDRDIVSETTAQEHMEELINSLSASEGELITKIFQAYDDRTSEKYDDINQYLYPDSDVVGDWKSLLTSFLTAKYGPKVAIKSGVKWADSNVENMGYKLVDWGDNGNHLLRHLDLPNSRNVPGSEGRPTVVALKDISSEERKVFYRARFNTAALLKEKYKLDDPYSKLNKVHVAESFEGCKERSVGGVETLRGMVRGEDIYLHQQTLSNFHEATGVLIHEMLHRYKGHEDATRDFEHELSMVGGFSTHEWTNKALKYNKKRITSGASDKQYKELINYLGD